MDQIHNVPFDDAQDDSENLQNDRFNKRLNVYRSHQNECKLRVDQRNSDELIEQKNHEIAELQKKSKEGKQKRVNKRGIRKQTEIDKVLKKNLN